MCSRKKTARSAGCPCRNEDKKCSSRCGCGKGRKTCKNGKIESTERENAQNLPVSAFDRHRTEIQQSVEEIKVQSWVDRYRLVNKVYWNACLYKILFNASTYFFQTFISSLSPVKMEKLLIELLSNGRGSLDYAKNIAKDYEDPDPDDPSAGEGDLPQWCVCGNCVPMENPQEQKCCTIRKCITSYELFHNLCLDRNVLEVAIKARCDMRADDLDFSTNSFRKASYRQYILWRYGRLGKGNRRICPSCVVRMIRAAYPSADGNYMGFRPC